MSKLNRFILNTDRDSLKIEKQIEWNLTIPAMVLQGTSNASYSYTFNVDSGVYFESFSVIFSKYPGYAATGSSWISFVVSYDSGTVSITYDVVIEKTGATTYEVRVEVDRSVVPGAPDSTSVSSESLDIKVNLLVPSERG